MRQHACLPSSFLISTILRFVLSIHLQAFPPRTDEPGENTTPIFGFGLITVWEQSNRDRAQDSPGASAVIVTVPGVS